ncbi:hypothetical protein [Clostridium akagii]|uniref:hypothetical protein n=1 Tax=Clostridium akagii TaxID=91623 RepID=UPI000478DF17|nr:hypothetical protein [Clostridium akagii]
MAVKVILENDMGKIDRQIKALAAIIPLDNEKDKNIHLNTLISLKIHKIKLESASEHRKCQEQFRAYKIELEIYKRQNENFLAMLCSIEDANCLEEAKGIAKGIANAMLMRC